jgi:uncharacterized membrane protein YgaE (UPF0421/DUF939 family)
MWNIVIGTLLTIFSGISFAAFGWAFVINTKVNVQEATQEIRNTDLKELLEEKFNAVDDKLLGLSDRLGRIERAMNGALKGH